MWQMSGVGPPRRSCVDGPLLRGRHEPQLLKTVSSVWSNSPSRVSDRSIMRICERRERVQEPKWFRSAANSLRDPLAGIHGKEAGIHKCENLRALISDFASAGR